MKNKDDNPEVIKYNELFDDLVTKGILESDSPRLRRVEFELDFEFWAIIPTININFHFPQIEFEWLCFGIYICLGK